MKVIVDTSVWSLALIPILCEDALMLQEIKNEPPRAPSTPRNKKLRDLAQLHKETVLDVIIKLKTHAMLQCCES
jgi:hypothetical protein